MEDEPDYVTISRHTVNRDRWMVCHMRFNRADDSYGIRTCMGPYSKMGAQLFAGMWARDFACELRLPEDS